MISVEDVSVRLGGERVVKNASFDVPRGKLVGLIGPNGAGKTTAIRAINGLVEPESGRVEIDGDRVADLSARTLGRRVATVPQNTSLGFDFPVRDVVSMGRTPHRSRFERESTADREAVERALRRTQLADLADRSIDSVSGGERQRVVLARALCQNSPGLLLDEPTASLDIGHGVAILDLVRGLVSEGKSKGEGESEDGGKAALAAIHDLDLAARFCDELVLLANGAVLAAGTPAAALTEAHLEAAFGVQVTVTPHPVTGAPSVTALSESSTASAASGASAASTVSTDNSASVAASGERNGANTENTGSDESDDGNGASTGNRSDGTSAGDDDSGTATELPDIDGR